MMVSGGGDRAQVLLKAPREAVLAPGGTPADPTVTLAMDRRTFSRLAGGRWNGDRARGAGGLHIEGDRDLGNRVVDNMAFTI